MFFQPNRRPGRRLLDAAIVAVFCMLFPVPRALPLYEAEAGFGRAAALLDQGQYLEALSGYQETAAFAASDEDRAKALFFVGAIYGLYLDQREGSIAYFDKVLTLYPHSAAAGDCQFNKGRVFFRQGEFEEARQVFVNYQNFHPEGPHILSAKAWERSAEIRLLDARMRPSEPTRNTGDATLRILIRKNAERLAVEGDPGFLCMDPVSGQILFEADKGTFSVKDGSLRVDSRDLETQRCELISKGKTMGAGKDRYKGLLILQAVSRGIDVINRVGVETYLYGAVPREMPPDWPEEALKAQAVVARSYALFIKEKRLNEPFDLMASAASQVYGGKDDNFARAIRAVDATRGQVLTHDGKLTLAYYHANSGGYTEGADKVWVAGIPYLQGIADPYSAEVPGSGWECAFTAEDIRQALADAGMDVGKITDLKLLDASASGRVGTVRILSESGAHSLRSDSFRLKIDPERIRSTRFSVTVQGDAFRFAGTGYGHGVGMSQWGARNMALGNETYQDILSYYYKGISLEILDYALNAVLPKP